MTFCLYTQLQKVSQAIAGGNPGGKSGLRRIQCQVTPGKRKLTESATENRPPQNGKGETVR